MLTHPAILERVITPDCGNLQVLAFDFPPADHARYAELSARAGEGQLTPEERGELEDYLTVNDFLSILKAQAQMSLRHQTPAA